MSLISNFEELIKSFINLDGVKWVHITVQGDAGKAEMILPLTAEESKPEIKVDNRQKYRFCLLLVATLATHK